MLPSLSRFKVYIILFFLPVTILAQSKKEQITSLQQQIDSISRLRQSEKAKNNDSLLKLRGQIDAQKTTISALETKHKEIQAQLTELKRLNDQLELDLNKCTECNLDVFQRIVSIHKACRWITRCPSEQNLADKLSHLNKIVLFEILKQDNNLAELKEKALWSLVNKMVEFEFSDEDAQTVFNSKEFKSLLNKYSDDNTNSTQLEQDFRALEIMELDYDKDARMVMDYLILSLNPNAMGSEFRLNFFRVSPDTAEEIEVDFSAYLSKINSVFKSDDIRFEDINYLNGKYDFIYSVFNSDSDNWPGSDGELKVTLTENHQIATIQFRKKLNGGGLSAWKQI